LSDKTDDEGIGNRGASGSDAWGSPATTAEGYGEGRQVGTAGRTSNGRFALDASSGNWNASIGRSWSAGGGIGIAPYISVQVSAGVGSEGSTNGAQLFVGLVGLGLVYPTPPSPFVSFTYTLPNQPPPSGKMFSGCLPSATIVTPIFSIQIIETQSYEPLSASISFGITAGLGEFGGWACPISLP
jgi:hypothetical protein